MTLKQFVKIAQNYTEIEHNCEDLLVVDLASNMLQTAYESLNKDDKHTVNVLCDSSILSSLEL